MSGATINVELHCHTVFSPDAFMTFDSLTQTAERVGLDALAITDHDTMDGALEFQRMAEASRLPLKIIVGEEKTLADGSHLIGLFLREPIRSSGLAAALQEIRAQGGLCLVPHPFRRKDGLLRDGRESVPLLRQYGTAFELFSAKCSFADNRKARDLLESGLAPFGGSDAHYECDLGESVNVVTWTGDLKGSLEQMFQGRLPFQIWGKRQREAEGERRYARLYYRVKPYLRLPGPLLPMAKQCYRRYRNVRYGIGRKALTEIYAHA